MHNSMQVGADMHDGGAVASQHQLQCATLLLNM